jgi:hypothetical protein
MPNPPKTYDSTLARIAGNIASGLVSPHDTFASRLNVEPIAGLAVALAQAIIKEAEGLYKVQQAEAEFVVQQEKLARG